jgi:hypothetical protein
MVRAIACVDTVAVALGEHDRVGSAVGKTLGYGVRALHGRAVGGLTRVTEDVVIGGIVAGAPVRGATMIVSRTAAVTWGGV